MVRPFGVEIRVAVQLALISAVAAVVQGFGDSQTGFSEDILGSNPQFRVDLADTTAGLTQFNIFDAFSETRPQPRSSMLFHFGFGGRPLSNSTARCSSGLNLLGLPCM